MKAFKLTIIALLLTVTATASASLQTSFTIVDSSDTSWVGQGLQNYTVDESSGWTFDVSSTFGNGISFSITGPDVPGDEFTDWFLTFAAPFGDVLQPGLYEDFQRWPFQDTDRAGLEFGGNGRLDNMASGDFTILEVTYDASGAVLSFAADFIHYGEQNEDNWAAVELRYNASQVPVPGAVWLFGSAFVGLAGLRRKAAQHQG